MYAARCHDDPPRLRLRESSLSSSRTPCASSLVPSPSSLFLSRLASAYSRLFSEHPSSTLRGLQPPTSARPDARSRSLTQLSENAQFAKKVEAAGLIFIGPQPEIIDGLGDKIKARQLAQKIQVPVVPGTPGAIEKFEEADAFVKEHGFPVIIKAAMGGGGRGMRVVRDQESFEGAFKSAVSEAKAAFGDGTVFVERFLDHPRHIECQLIGDSHGNVVHLFERDCSVQRRHQKVVELGPATNFSEERRQQLLNCAVKIAKEVGYRNAGTCEFLVDDRGIYFIEINVRSDPLSLSLFGARSPSRSPPRNSYLLSRRPTASHPGRAHRHRGDHGHRHHRRPDPGPFPSLLLLSPLLLPPHLDSSMH